MKERYKDNMDKVLVLMSVYNGEKYIEEQLKSIVGQKNVEVHLLIRDDGSMDRTAEIIGKYLNKDISFYKGENCGAAKSFLKLMKKAYVEYPDFEFIALADQDDIWLECKLEQALKLMKQRDAALYCGSLDAYTNGNLEEHILIRCFQNTLYETMLRNSVAGCTMVIRSSALATICEYEPVFLEMHDSWIVRVCTYTGQKVIYDPNSYMRYRLHGNNTCGAAITVRNKLRVHFNNVFRRNPDRVSNTAHELLKGYRNRIEEDACNYLEILDKSITVNNRKIKLLKLCNRIGFSTISRRIDFIVEVILGKI